MEQCRIARQIAANFNRLAQPCTICTVPGDELAEADKTYVLKNPAEIDRIIMRARQRFRQGKEIGKAREELQERSLLPVRV